MRKVGYNSGKWLKCIEVKIERPGKEPLTAEIIYTGDDWDDYKPHLWAFFQAVRNRKPVVEDAVFGNHAAIACHMANESYFSTRQVFWDANTRTVKT